MILMPYDTHQGRMYQTDKIISQIKRAQIDLPLPEVETPGGNVIKNLHFVTPSEEHEDVNLFTQYVNLGTDQEPRLVLDGRPYMRYDRRTGTYRLTAENDYMFQCIRGALTLRLMKGDKAAIRRLGDVPLIAFTRWITLALSQKFNLDLAAELKVSIAVAYYFLGMSDDDIATDAEARMQMANIVQRVTKAELRLVMEVADTIKSLKTFDDLARTVSEDLGTIRMGKLKYPDIWTLVAGSFSGVNYRENVGVALEHLPTFIAMVYCALEDRSYRKSVIFLRAKSAGSERDHKTFTDLVYREVAEQFK
ncbi:hypothetical protein D3C87_1129390 [compost metagenome]